jgi:perosamine synthetase
MIHLASPLISDDEIEAVVRVMKSGQLAQGPEVTAFEHEFAAAFDQGQAVAVSNGTDALIMAFRALGIGPGDEVIVPSFTFAATANAVVLTGAQPVFADVDPRTFCVMPEHISPLVTPATKAIVAVHLYGQMAPMRQVSELARSRGIHLIEDAAQAHGARRDGEPVGRWSDVSTYSFFPTKNMTTGEGGMVTTRSPELAAEVRLLRNHGMETRYYHEKIGTNARMTDLGAAIGRAQLRKVTGWNRRRREIAAYYDEHLGRVVDTPYVAPGAEHVYHQYTIRTERRDRIIAACEDAGVGYGIYYPIPCHRQASFRGFFTGSALANTDEAAEQVLSIPIRPDLADGEIDRVVATIRTGGRS